MYLKKYADLAYSNTAGRALWQRLVEKDGALIHSLCSFLDGKIFTDKIFFSMVWLYGVELWQPRAAGGTFFIDSAVVDEKALRPGRAVQKLRDVEREIRPDRVKRVVIPNESRTDRSLEILREICSSEELMHLSSSERNSLARYSPEYKRQYGLLVPNCFAQVDVRLDAVILEAVGR